MKITDEITQLSKCLRIMNGILKCHLYLKGAQADLKTEIHFQRGLDNARKWESILVRLSKYYNSECDKLGKIYFQTSKELVA